MFFRGLISATTKEEARRLLLELFGKKLAAGGLISEGNSIYWWEGELVEKTYYNLSIFTIDRHKKGITDLVKSIHSDEVPIIVFFKIDEGNQDFLDWISDSIT